MSWSLRDRPGVWTAIASAIVYLVLGLLFLFPRGDAPTPELRLPLSVATAASNALTIGLLSAGWIYIRSGRTRQHRLLMILAMVTISGFLILYVSRQYLVGTLEFEGPEVLRQYVYLPLLYPHLVLSAAAVPPVIYNFLIGISRRLDEVGMTRHPLVGRIVVPVWLLSSALGLVIFTMLQYYHFG